MGFWIRNAIIAVLLIGLAVAFFLYKDVLLSSEQEAPQAPVSQDQAKKTNGEKTPEVKKPVKDANAAAEGLSNFYAKVYGDKGDRKVRNNVIFLPEPEGDLVKTLQAREKMVRPYRKNWVGNKDSRPFRKGETLYQKLSEYSGNEGLEIIWWLDKDFIVKEPFRIDKDILGMAKQIGQAVSGHFPEGVNSYFCYRHRTLVFIGEPPSYLGEECTLLE